MISEIQKAAEANALKAATLRNDMEKHKKLNGSLEEVEASTSTSRGERTQKERTQVAKEDDKT